MSTLGFRIRPVAGATLLLATLVGCRSAEAESGIVCPTIGTPTGIGVDVSPEFAKLVGDPPQLTACWDGGCHEAFFLGNALNPSTRSVDQGCTPDGSCSAEAVPTGGKNGFGNIDGLPAEPVQVTLRIPPAPGGRPVDGSVTVTAKRLQPGGPGCSGGGVQGHVNVDATGTVAAS